VFNALGGVSLGLKKGSSETLGLLDVAATLEAFETINACRIWLKMTILPRRGNSLIAMEATAERPGTPAAEAQHLVSVSLTFSPSEYQSLDAAAFRLLYMLDGRLADQGLSGDNRKSVASPAKG
jgi:hypothetical protein